MPSSESIFKKGSKTYYYSSLFFPPEIKKQIFTLYAFVRTADNFVDSTPQQKKEFLEFYKETEIGLKKHISKNEVINNFVQLIEDKKIPNEWVLAFLNSMSMDLEINTYQTFNDLKKYIYGSAEVIGLIIGKILNLPDTTEPFARSLGSAMQLINFIRDVPEDLELGRVYIPHEDMVQFEVKNLSPKTIKEKENFSKLMKHEIDRYRLLQKEAEKGFSYIPKKYLIPIKTASDMYNWTANVIHLKTQ